MQRSCEYCGNRVELDETAGRYICTVCYTESQAATFVTQEFDEALLSNRSTGKQRSARAMAKGEHGP